MTPRNTHGHVTPNADGSKARCGGPIICATCQFELAQKYARYTPAPAKPSQEAKAEPTTLSVLGDTGNVEADRLIGRLTSADPDFEDCMDAAILLRRLVLEEISGPKGYATWKDAAVAERLARVSMRPSESVVAMAREGLEVYSGPNMNERKVCAEIVRLAEIHKYVQLPGHEAKAAPAEVPYALRQWAMDDEPESTLFDEGYNAARRWVKMQLEKPAEPTEAVEVAGVVCVSRFRNNPAMENVEFHQAADIPQGQHPLMTVAQHKRLMANHSADDNMVKVPRELVLRAVTMFDMDEPIYSHDAEDLRALLGGEV